MGRQADRKAAAEKVICRALRPAEKNKNGYCWVYVRQYCAKIDEAARNRMELIVPELAKRNDVTEKLKADTKWDGYGR